MDRKKRKERKKERKRRRSMQMNRKKRKKNREKTKLLQVVFDLTRVKKFDSLFCFPWKTKKHKKAKKHFLLQIFI